MGGGWPLLQNHLQSLDGARAGRTCSSSTLGEELKNSDTECEPERKTGMAATHLLRFGKSFFLLWKIFFFCSLLEILVEFLSAFPGNFFLPLFGYLAIEYCNACDSDTGKNNYNNYRKSQDKMSD